MVARTAFEQLNFSIYILLICCFGMFLIYIIPYIFFVISLLYINTTLLITNSMILILIYLAFFPVSEFYGNKKFFTSNAIFCFNLCNDDNFFRIKSFFRKR